MAGSIAGGQAYVAPYSTTESGTDTFNFAQGGTVSTDFRTSSSLTTQVTNHDATVLSTNLTNGYDQPVVIGSVKVVVGGYTLVDRNSTLYRNIDPITNAGTSAGSIQYGTGKLSLTSWVEGANNTAVLKSLATKAGLQPITAMAFRIPIIPIRVGSLQILGNFTAGGSFNVVGDNDGNISGSGIKGAIDYESGICKVQFGTVTTITVGNRASIEAEPWYDSSLEYIEDGADKILVPLFVNADSIRFNAVAYTYLPLQADILGLNPVRLPSDGKVPIFRDGSVIVVNCTKTNQFATGTASESLTLDDDRITTLRVIDSATPPAVIDPVFYTANLNAGTVVLSGSFSNSGLDLPLLAEYRIEDMVMCTDVQINGQIALNRVLTHTYPAYDTLVSAALIIGDKQAREHSMFAQASWASLWQDSPVGSPITPQYNNIIYPVEVTNAGAIEERWALIFTGTTSFRIVGETSGQIGTGDTTSEIAPLNPITGVPYFTIFPEGWGTGWAAGNTLRFNTASSNYPVWCARTVLQGAPTTDDDAFVVQMRGDINA